MDQDWSAVTNLSLQSLPAGQRFLVYVLYDIDFDGVSNLPVDLYVSSAHNTGNVSIGGIPENSYYLAGNPYTKTLDWDNISKTNLSSSISVWDDASGEIGSFTIQEVDIATAAGTFRGRTTDADSSGYIVINATHGGMGIHDLHDFN